MSSAEVLKTAEVLKNSEVLDTTVSCCKAPLSKGCDVYRPNGLQSGHSMCCLISLLTIAKLLSMCFAIVTCVIKIYLLSYRQSAALFEGTANDTIFCQTRIVNGSPFSYF